MGRCWGYVTKGEVTNISGDVLGSSNAGRGRHPSGGEVVSPPPEIVKSSDSFVGEGLGTPDLGRGERGLPKITIHHVKINMLCKWKRKNIPMAITMHFADKNV